MSLWARFTARRQARKAERKAIATRKLQDRMEAQASLRRALILGGGAHISVDHMPSSYESSHHYHGSIGTDCGPNITGNCPGTGL